MAITKDMIHSNSAPVSTNMGERRLNPVRWWAAFGALCVGVQVYVFGRWILSDNFTPSPSGPDPIPGWMSLAAHLHEVVSVLMFLVCIYLFVVRPFRAERRIPMTGMIVLAVPWMYWQDLAANYFNPTYVFNTAFVNRGSWYNFIPGWVSPNAERLVEPFLFTMTVNVWGVLLPAMMFVAVMRKAKARYPRLGTLGLWMVAFAVAFPFDLLLEGSWLRLGLYSFAGTHPSLTVFSGHHYQIPIYEILFAGLYYAAYAAILYFKDDKGRTAIERGMDSIRVKPAHKGMVRFFAFVGAVNLIMLVFNVAMAVIGVLPGFTWNSDVVLRRSYLRDGLCGAGTTYACPGVNIPIPRQGRPHVSPEGDLVIPAGVKFPGPEN